MSDSGNFRYTVGLNNVGPYQVSGMPFIVQVNPSAAGGVVVKFPYVTNWIVVQNMHNTDPVNVGFSQNAARGNASNGFTLQGKTSNNNNPLSRTHKMEVKVTEIYLSASVANLCQVMAGLTTVPIQRINNNGVSPSGSNWSGSYDLGGFADGYGIG